MSGVPDGAKSIRDSEPISGSEPVSNDGTPRTNLQVMSDSPQPDVSGTSNVSEIVPPNDEQRKPQVDASSPADQPPGAAFSAEQPEYDSGSDVDELVKEEERDSVEPGKLEERMEAYSKKATKRSIRLATVRALKNIDEVGAGSAAEFAMIRDLTQSVGVQRAISLIICWLQLFFVFLVTVIISAQHRSTIVENLRTVCLLVGAVLTVLAMNNLKDMHIGPAEQAFRFLGLKLFSLIFELQLFTVTSDWPTLFIFGIISAVTSLIACGAMLHAFMSIRHDDPNLNELEYSRYSAHRHLNVTVAMVKALRGFVEAQPDLHHRPQEDADAAVAVQALRLAEIAVDHAQNVEIGKVAVAASESEVPAHSSVRAEGDDGAASARSGEGSASTRSRGKSVAETVSQQFSVDVFKQSAATVVSEAAEAVQQQFGRTLDRAGMLGDSKAPGEVGLESRLAKWYAATRIRKALIKKDQTGNRVTILLLLVFFLFAIGNVTYEFAKIFANQPPLFSDDLNKFYNARSRITDYFGTSRTHSTWKVHMVVVDGLRYDHTEAGASALGDLVNTAAFRANSQRLEMEAQIPSFSVPNWLTMLSGAPPEQTGVTGNLFASETEYDHVYAQCEAFGVHAGLTGTPWWRDLIFSTVPTLDGDGTIWSDYVPEGSPEYSWLTSNPADEARLAVALTAARRSTIASPFPSGAPQLYQFFLSHFSDVDKQGHEYGIDTKWNTDNTYMRAIENKTAAIQQIINAIDDDTILIITSDHGHVKRGGHGGVSEVLRRVPVIFYNKNRAMTAGTRAAFGGSTRTGIYENTDLVATITALLGVPAPRQTTGVFMEEVVRDLVPASVLNQHYYDLFRARFSLVDQMMEHIGFDFWGDLRAGSNIESDIVQQVYNANGTGTTEAQFGEAIAKLHDQYRGLRDNLALFALMRNLLASIFFFLPVVFVVAFTFEIYTVVSISSFWESNASRYRSENLYACLKALATVFLHILISTVSFVIGYFGVVGYSVWDSTLTHTPSVAITFLTATVIAPVFYYVLLSRLFLFKRIRWYTMASVREFRAIFTKKYEDEEMRPKFNHLVFLGWVYNLLRDIMIFCFGTSRYRRSGFAGAYLYLYFLAFWSIVAAFIMLFLCFPFAFMVPIVFSNTFVSEFNAEFRFRMITMLMLVLPLLLGTALLLFMMPRYSPTTILVWDQALMELDVEKDIARLRAKVEKHEESKPDASATVDDIERHAKEGIRLRNRLKLAVRSAHLLMDKDFAYTESSLLQSKLMLNESQANTDMKAYFHEGETEAFPAGKKKAGGDKKKSK